MSFGPKPARLHWQVAVVAAMLLPGVIVAGCGSGSSTSQSPATASTSLGSGATSNGRSESDSARPNDAASVPTSTPRPEPTEMASTTGGVSSSTTPGPSGSDLLAPTGTFLSSHRLSLSGSDVPSRARSVCHTTPGATCVIAFSMAGTSQSLPAQQTDSSGDTSWDWSPGDLGLGVGHWDVRITASMGSSTSSVDEAIGLEVVS